MTWTRGLIRLWLVASVLFLACCAWLAWSAHEEFGAAITNSAKWESLGDSQESSAAMAAHLCGTSRSPYYEFEVKYGLARTAAAEAKTCVRQARRQREARNTYMVAGLAAPVLTLLAGFIVAWILAGFGPRRS